MSSISVHRGRALLALSPDERHAHSVQPFNASRGMRTLSDKSGASQAAIFLAEEAGVFYLLVWRAFTFLSRHPRPPMPLGAPPFFERGVSSLSPFPRSPSLLPSLLQPAGAGCQEQE